MKSNLFRLAVGLWLLGLSDSRATEGNPPLETTIGAKLTELEARAVTENSYLTANPAFHRDVEQLVESNTLSSGEDFFRAANLASAPVSDFRSARMRYELMLICLGSVFARSPSQHAPMK